ncbi:hypothetical protein V1477_006307, partial [Vespula maculifrons]
PWRTGPGSLERARRALCAHIFFVQIGPIGADLTRFKGSKGKKIFFNNFFLRNYSTYENRTRVNETGPSRPLRPYFLRTDRTNRSRVITHLGEPVWGPLKGLVAPSTPIFFAIFLSGSIAPRRTELRSLERNLHALYAHIFFVQIGPIGAEL